MISKSRISRGGPKLFDKNCSNSEKLNQFSDVKSRRTKNNTKKFIVNRIKRIHMIHTITKAEFHTKDSNYLIKMAQNHLRRQIELDFSRKMLEERKTLKKL